MKIIWTWVISMVVLRIVKEMGYFLEIFEQYQMHLLGSVLVLGIIIQILWKSNRSSLELELDDDTRILPWLLSLIVIIGLGYVYQEELLHLFYTYVIPVLMVIGLILFFGFINDMERMDVEEHNDTNPDSFGKGIAWAVGAQKAHEAGHNGLLGAYAAGKAYDIATGKVSIKDAKPNSIMTGILLAKAGEEYNKNK